MPVQLAAKLRNDSRNGALFQSIEPFRRLCDEIEKAAIEIVAPEMLAKHADRSASGPIQPAQALILALGIATEGNARPKTGGLRH